MRFFPNCRRFSTKFGPRFFAWSQFLFAPLLLQWIVQCAFSLTHTCTEACTLWMIYFLSTSSIYQKCLYATLKRRVYLYLQPQHRQGIIKLLWQWWFFESLLKFLCKLCSRLYRIKMTALKFLFLFLSVFSFKKKYRPQWFLRSEK